MQVMHIVGARPNFMKAAPVIRALAECEGVSQSIVHTGQHYDANLSDVFFRELGIPEPTVNLQVGSGTHAEQTAEVMCRLEPLVREHKPDLVLVYGDVNSTLAAALVCAKLLIQVGHVEAGLRSFDRTMPEEVNRVLTDQISDLLFTHSRDADENLAREGIPPEKVFLVGNTMIDTLVRMLPRAQERVFKELPARYALVTLHRPSNVDDLKWLREMVEALEEISSRTPVLFSVHPRTRQRLVAAGLPIRNENGLRFLEPLPYLDFLALQSSAILVITDSGGIQEETTFMHVPCLTMRENTERPVTIEMGTNILIGRSTQRLKVEVERILGGMHSNGRVPPLWDGHAGERIASRVVTHLRKHSIDAPTRQTVFGLA